jgi:hypothetical protein
MTIKTITRRSKVGWNWNPWTPEHPEPPEYPYYVGSPRTVKNQIDNSREWSSMKSTYTTTAWFVRHNGKWVRVNNQEQFESELYDLLYSDKNGWGEKVYLIDTIYVDLETN